MRPLPFGTRERPDWAESITPSPKRLQERKVLPESGGESAEIVTGHAVTLRHQANNWPQPAIMGVRDVGEQVMFDLVVQTAREPSRQP